MRIRWADSAREDFDRAIDHIEAQSGSGARRVAERIVSAIDLLEQFPEAAPKSRHRGLRQLVVSRTPYIVVYRIEGDWIEIRAVVHAAQKRRK
ncbi:MAG: type II toxin-antitoxin system RelE/ParE family toxin [Hyphomonadaceae bacterium]|nr:type II toxin-antitoxin system RelE/ParE family toxin [Hyphomonadaceae bacterium]